MEFKPTGTTEKRQYGDGIGLIEHGQCYNSDGSIHRLDRWTWNDEQPIIESWFAGSMNDDSPHYRGEYDPKCSCCWLHFGHTVECHNERISRNK